MQAPHTLHLQTGSLECSHLSRKEGDSEQAWGSLSHPPAFWRRRGWCENVAPTVRQGLAMSLAGQVGTGSRVFHTLDPTEHSRAEVVKVLQHRDQWLQTRLTDQLTDSTSLCLTRKRADGPLCSVISWEENVSIALFFLPDRRKAEAGPRPLPGYVDQSGHKRTPKCFFLTWDNAIQFSPHPIVRERERERRKKTKKEEIDNMFSSLASLNALLLRMAFLFHFDILVTQWKCLFLKNT